MTATPAQPAAEARPLTATLIARQRLTPPGSPEDVMQLRFATDDAGFDTRIGQCVRVRAPGRFGQRHHERLYSIADLDRSDPQRTEFELLVRRCDYLDEFSGERLAGVASNHLCDLALGQSIELTGPVGYPFEVPADPEAPLLMIGMGTGIAPFRGLVHRIYDTLGGWRAPVRLFYGARSALEMLYMNNQNDDLAHYGDEATFRAFQAVSPRPAFDAPPALGQALAAHAAEVATLLQDRRTQVFVAGPQAMLAGVEAALAQAAGGDAATPRATLLAEGRWHELLY